MLSRHADAAYVGEVVAAWAGRYLGRAAGEDTAAGFPEADADEVVVRESGEARLMQHVVARHHRSLADEPENYGGTDRGPTPYELLLAGLGACTSMTLRLYADRKKWPLERTTVSLRHDRIHAEDCENCETKEGKVDLIRRDLRLEGDLSDDQRDRLLQIADKCPVHRTLTGEIRIETELDKSK